MKILLAVFATAMVGVFFPSFLPYIAAVAFVGVVIILFQERTKRFSPKSQEYKELEKIKRKREKEDDKKHKKISDQFMYIQFHWGYTKTQSRIIQKALEERAYRSIYRKLTISILPQLIELIDICNKKEKKGCKQDINKRLNELTSLLKNALKQQKEQAKEEYEISLEVLDRLFKEFKN